MKQNYFIYKNKNIKIIIFFYLLFLININLTNEAAIKKNDTSLSLNDNTKNDITEKPKEIIKNSIGLSSSLNDKSQLSSVVNLAPGFNPQNFLKVSNNPNLSCEIDGKLRFDSQFGTNISHLNSQYSNLDTILLPGKTILDLGFAFGYGEQKYGYNCVELGINLRNKATFGVPDGSGSTTKTEIKDGMFSLGSHNHRIGIPILYVRGLDFTFDLNTLCLKGCEQYNFLKIGFFPFEIGRGISLGSAYAVTPDFISYSPGDVIQEFAPGLMIYGFLDTDKKVGYKLYSGLLQNWSSSLADINSPIRRQEYGRLYSPQRGFGVMNFVCATQLDYSLSYCNINKILFSPYIIYLHDGEEVINYNGDSHTDLGTFGYSITATTPYWEISAEFAKNIGTQSVVGVDNNVIKREQRIISFTDSNNNNVSVPCNIEINNEIIYTKDNSLDHIKNADIQNKTAVYLPGSSRQKAIDNVFRDSSNNSEIIYYNNGDEKNFTDIKNTNDRFTDAYSNSLQGWMGVIDITRKLICNDYKIDLSLALGVASGDENPNGSLESANDHIKNSVYSGFIGIQEIYVGKRVRSVFMMSGAGKIARVLSVPALKRDESGDVIGFPSRISRFTNLIYTGFSTNILFNSNHYAWRINPNILWYNQLVRPEVYNARVKRELDKNYIDSYLGMEINIFIEAVSNIVNGLKFFATATLFIPGSYYNDLSHVALNRDQARYMRSIAQDRHDTPVVPLMSNNNAFYINIGLEFKF